MPHTTKEIDLRFKPVTMGLFLDACESLGIDRDKAWESPLMAQDLIGDISLDQGKAFLEIVLEEIPDVPEEELKAVIAYCTHGENGFFATERKRYLEKHGDTIFASLTDG